MIGGHVAYGSFATEAIQQQVRTCLVMIRKRKSNQGIGICCDRHLLVDGVARRVIQAPKPEPRIMRYELTDHEWVAIKPFLERPDPPPYGGPGLATSTMSSAGDRSGHTSELRCLRRPVRMTDAG